ncbi:MAG: homoserine kinase [Nocardiopsaceae bacterium]|nr:homoserine kinase [Nocardiopsaceae bacterium]
MSGFRDGPVRVTVPATSANLGPGYDTLGLALGLHDSVSARVASSGLALSVAGEGAAEVAEAGEKHLVVSAMRATFDALGTGQPPGIELRCENRIPHGRGLGSSAAAICGGILAARALAGASAGPGDALPLASALEGHPDNVAPCLYGGLTIAWLPSSGPGLAPGPGSAGGVRAVRLEPLPEVRAVVFVPDAPVSTEVARGLLPDKVPHADAAVNAGRAALLVAALTVPTQAGGRLGPDGWGGASRAEALLDATDDRLHQDYRAPAMPGTRDLVRRLRAAGVPAVVSGAGPSVLAFVADDLHKLDSTAKETGNYWRISPLDIERRGASVICGASSAR